MNRGGPSSAAAGRVCGLTPSRVWLPGGWRYQRAGAHAGAQAASQTIKKPTIALSLLRSTACDSRQLGVRQNHLPELATLVSLSYTASTTLLLARTFLQHGDGEPAWRRIAANLNSECPSVDGPALLEAVEVTVVAFATFSHLLLLTRCSRAPAGQGRGEPSGPSDSGGQLPRRWRSDQCYTGERR